MKMNTKEPCVNSSPSKRRKSKNNKDVVLSKALSWVLRHGALKIGLTMSSDGYVPLQILLKSKVRNLNKYTMDDVMNVVESNDKQRFKLCRKIIVWKDAEKTRYIFGSSTSLKNADIESTSEEVLCIRANQGHSIKGLNSEHLLNLIPPNELAEMKLIIHGTNIEAWEKHIQHEGLSKMNRNHIHFAAGLPGEGGIISGMRQSSQVYIYINGMICAKDGIKFYRSDNGVILCPGFENGILPTKYFADVVDAKTKKSLLV